VPDFTTTISINCCGWISNFIGFTVCFTAFYFDSKIYCHGLPIGHPQDICLEPPADPLDAEGHQAEATLRTRGGTHGMKQITIDALMLTTGRHKTSQSNTRHLEAM